MSDNMWGGYSAETLGDITAPRGDTLVCNTLIYRTAARLRFGRSSHKTVLLTDRSFHIRRVMVLKGNFWGHGTMEHLHHGLNLTPFILSSACPKNTVQSATTNFLFMQFSSHHLVTIWFSFHTSFIFSSVELRNLFSIHIKPWVIIFSKYYVHGSRVLTEMTRKSTAFWAEALLSLETDLFEMISPIVSVEDHARQETSRSWMRAKHAPSGPLLGPLAENGPFHSSLQASIGLFHSAQYY
jgi:hypothetical protein